MNCDMSCDTNALRIRLWAHPFDSPDAPRPFSRKLAEQNGWRHDYALRVIEEYRRFIYLAMVSGQVVTPSDTVDQAWHLHLTCTRDYWEVFCPTVLGRPLHHDPGNGSAADAHRHAAQYAATLVAYRQHFGAEAPVDIWPRAATGAEFVRVDLRRFWLLPRLPRLSWHTGLSLSLGFTSLLLASCVVRPEGNAGFNVLDFNGPHFLFFYVQAILIYALLRMAFYYCPGIFAFSDDNTHNPSMSAEQLAYLKHGPARAAEVAIFRLCQAGHIKLDASRQVVQVAPAGGETHLESTILDRVRRTGRLYDGSDSDEAAAFAEIRHQLVDAAMLQPPPRRINASVVLDKLGQLLFALGMIKVLVGVVRGTPVGFLILILLFFFAHAAPGWQSRKTHTALTRVGKRAVSYWEEAGIHTDRTDRLAYRLAVMGASALMGTEWALLYPKFLHSHGDGGGCGGGGGSCGGGCGGGGCGGCGGGGD